MSKIKGWAVHAIVAIITAGLATGAIYDPHIVPPAYSHYVVVGIMVIGYLLGVNFTTPGNVALPADHPATQEAIDKIVQEAQNAAKASTGTGNQL